MRHFINEKVARKGWLSQRLLGLLLGTAGEKLANSWPARPH